MGDWKWDSTAGRMVESQTRDSCVSEGFNNDIEAYDFEMHRQTCEPGPHVRATNKNDIDVDGILEGALPWG